MLSGHRETRRIPGRHNTSFCGRKRLSDDGPRTKGEPKRRRMNGEDGKNKKQAPKPIGFKALERICREELPENTVLEITRKAQQFEALLSMEDIRPDLLKLVISSFRMLCSSNNFMTANAEKILRSTTAKTFLTGKVLSSFIDKMAYLGDHSAINTVIMDLTDIFLTMIQKLGESIVHSLPIPQLSFSLATLKEKKLIENADDLEKKLQRVTRLRDEVIRQAMLVHDQESLIKPPQNFRELSIIPTATDLCSRPFLRKNITDRKFSDLDHYLDVQFRLLREDFVMPLRDGIKQLKDERDSLEPSATSNTRRTNDIFLYYNVTVLHPVCNKKGRVYKIKFDVSSSKVKRVRWERSKRLKFGSLICLSSDDFNTFVFASVENRDPDSLSRGELEVRFENTEIGEVNQFVQRKEEFAMVESDAYFESYRHVLEALQEIKPEEFPFQRYIVECCQDIRPPEYQLQEKEASDSKHSFSFRFDGLLAKNKSSKTHVTNLHSSALKSPAAITHATDSSQEVELSAGPCAEPLNNPDVAMDNGMPHKIFNWPDRESLGFNESQMRAFKLALTKEFALIQGPPGTGKTFVGLKISRALLENSVFWQKEGKSLPILMVSYTNHALDQFLEGLLTMVPDQGIVRVGGRSKSEKLKQFNLKSLRVPWASSVANARRTTRSEVEMLRQSYQRSSLFLKALKSCIISLDVFIDEECMRRRHYHQFSALAIKRSCKSSFNDGLLKWLDIARNDRSLANDDGTEETLMEVSTRGYNFDNNEGDVDKGDKALLQTITVLSIKDADNPNYMRRNLANEAMSDDEEQHVGSIVDLDRRSRWRLYRLWCKRLENHQQDNLQRCQVEFEEALIRQKELDTKVEYDVLRQAKVIGMTTTGAARYRHILQRISPKIVLVEEAAEILEAHLITSLSKGCQHLILIGDHQQLRPTPAVYELAKKYKLDVSLFERMVNVGMPCEKLSVQHRMRPEIAALLKHIYPDLENHESVAKHENIKGMKKNLFFVNHSHLENDNDESHSHTNEHEASFLVSLCRYLLQQGYSAREITLLTTYTGQMFAIRDCLKRYNNGELKNVRLTTVDNFQGEENDIILLSLVRSNKKEKVGFIKIVNRACVALSRAKKGFYCIGNFDLLSKHSVIWSKIVADLKTSGSIGNALPLVCETHKDEVSVEKAEDFNDKVPDGGCQRRCEVRLGCGHACKLLCHPGDPKHKKYVCGESCARTIEGCTHTCPNACCEPCQRYCKVIVEKKLPGCNHIVQAECGSDLITTPCKERCHKSLSCGHRCQDYCQRPCTTKCMELVKKTDWPCRHEVTIACSATPSDCSVPCKAPLDCGHPCPGNCGECRMGRVHQRCKMRCGRVLVCSHVCKESCAIPCPPCFRKCENRCIHSKCDENCGEPCVPCREPCSWECRHHKCFKRCHEMCDRPRCNIPCEKILPCYHVCRGLMCEKECICTVCDKNDGLPITTIFLGGEDENDAQFIKLPDCGHIFAVSDLDSYMDMSEDDSTESHVVQMKGCPRCTKPIRLSLRYGKVIRQELQDIENIKKEILAQSNPGLSNKNVLLDRLAMLSTKLNSRTHERFWRTLERSVLKVQKRLVAHILENKVMLMERHCLVTEKLEKYLRILPEEICAENVFSGRQVENDLAYLLKRFMADIVTTRELADVNTEFSRIVLHLELCLLSHEVKGISLQLDQSFCEMMTTVRKELSSGKLIKDERLDELMNNLSVVREAYPVLKPLSQEQKKQIVEAIGLKPGHWFKCPKGHYYVIGECGGAMQRSTCPECGAVIGGAQHQLEEGNELAPEMDDARFPAWSEQANLQNYNLRDEVQ